MGHPTSLPWINALRLWIFIPFLCAGWVCYLVYGLNTLRKRRNYFLRVRFPSLALMDLSQSLFTLHAVCLHEIYLAQGRHLSCKVTNLATVLTPTNYLAIFLVRVLQLIVIFDPNFRERFYRVLPRFKLGIFLLSVVVAVTFTLAMNLSPTPFCHTPELCDVEGSCVWGASYYLVLILVGLFHLVLVPALRHMMKLDIQERIGFTLEFKRILAMSVTLNSVIFATLALVDWGVLCADWHIITDLTLCVAFANNFYIGHVMPARKFGYAPSLPLAVRRLRRQLRHWVHKKVKALRAGPRKGPKILAADRPIETTETWRKENEPARIEAPEPPRLGGSGQLRPAPSRLGSKKKLGAVGRGLSAMGKSMRMVVQQLEGADSAAITTTTEAGSDMEAAALSVDHLTLDEMFDHQQLRQALIAHCKNHLDEESILFLLDTRDLRAMDLAGTMGPGTSNEALVAVDRVRLAWLCERYLRVDGLYALQLSSPVQGAVYRLLRWEGTKRYNTIEGKPSVPEDVTTDSILRMLKQVGRDVERSVEDNLLPIFFRSDPAYAAHSPAVIVAGSTEQSKRRADVNCDRAARAAMSRTDMGETRKPRKFKGGLRGFGSGGGGGEGEQAGDVEKGQEAGLV